MNEELCIPPSIGFEDGRSVSDVSNTSTEQLALMGFAYQLCSSVYNNDGIADEKTVRKEAELLMSLSCSSPTNIIEETGRITPQSDTSSCYSYGSKRDSFCFTCPSLSLENHSRGSEEDNVNIPSTQSTEEGSPSVLLGRSLKVADRDALRLSSEAMGINIMQSYKKAIDWRIQSWMDSLSRILAKKEKSLVGENASEDEIRELLKTGEAKLLLQLRELAEKIKVVDGSTSFKVLPQRVKKADGEEPPTKRQRLGVGEAGSLELEEAEYQYHVAHVMALVGYLNISTPAGHVQIDLEVPGSMTGTFLSVESDSEELTDVRIELNTEILAAMIEKSSRMVVRASIEAFLKDDDEEEVEEVKEEISKPTITKEDAVNTATSKPLATTFTPKRRVSEEHVSGLVVITPARDASSPSSYGDSDSDEKPVILSIPNDFKSGQTKPNLRMLTPQPSKAGGDMENFTFGSRLKRKENSLPTVVTPGRNSKPEVIAKGKGPSPVLPMLVEAACAAMRGKKEVSH